MVTFDQTQEKSYEKSFLAIKQTFSDCPSNHPFLEGYYIYLPIMTTKLSPEQAE